MLCTVPVRMTDNAAFRITDNRSSHRQASSVEYNTSLISNLRARWFKDVHAGTVAMIRYTGQAVPHGIPNQADHAWPSFLSSSAVCHCWGPAVPTAREFTASANSANQWHRMSEFLQERHKPPLPLDRPREMIVACPPMRSHVNLSRIMRAAGCCGLRRMICCGNAKVIGKIARDAGQCVEIELHRTLPPVLERLGEEGYQIVALEQTGDSTSIFEFNFPRKAVLVIGNERSGIEEAVLQQADHLIEIPVYGRPYAHNAATAAIMALYEYCRQYPRG